MCGHRLAVSDDSQLAGQALAGARTKNPRHRHHQDGITRRLLMEKRLFGKTDMQVSVLGFGGAEIAALQEARQRGYTRYIGYSGDGQAARHAIECGAFDTLQTSVSIADQVAIELTLPLAQSRQMGVIAKRPIANAAWRYAQRPENAYHQPYWDRLQKLRYDFLGGDPQQAAGTALRFTLS